ncbi:hypothetical protein PGIGA_G00098990 [Pangasianodon gigas]|uniref:Uncharacterized protein n=1 Tax=Pangasianodon gigas TaxID=30993 RepID=A0ACC5XDS9_PANGG|nr:hypothetical protein [Pangasianodon gigas]
MHESDITHFLGYTTISGVQPRPLSVQYGGGPCNHGDGDVDVSRNPFSLQTNRKRVARCCWLCGVADSEPRKGAPGITTSAARFTPPRSVL